MRPRVPFAGKEGDAVREGSLRQVEQAAMLRTVVAREDPASPHRILLRTSCQLIRSSCVPTLSPDDEAEETVGLIAAAGVRTLGSFSMPQSLQSP